LAKNQNSFLLYKNNDIKEDYGRIIEHSVQKRLPSGLIRFFERTIAKCTHSIYPR
jgi:hypothetical protein